MNQLKEENLVIKDVKSYCKFVFDQIIDNLNEEQLEELRKDIETQYEKFKKETEQEEVKEDQKI